MSWDDIKAGDLVVWNGDNDADGFKVDSVDRATVDPSIWLYYDGDTFRYTLSQLERIARVVHKAPQRKPKHNEIWTLKGVKYKFVGPVDARGKAAWMSMDDNLHLFSLSEMVPPTVKPDDSVLANMWINVYPVSMSADYADRIAHHDRIGRVNLLGEWVECDGQEVLG